jgi:hypothetical protein
LSSKTPKNSSLVSKKQKEPRLSKKEKRLLREQSQKEEFNIKKERLINSVKKIEIHKTPKHNTTPNTSKDPNRYYLMNVEWNCENPDTEGEWSWRVKRNQLITDKEEIYDFALFMQKLTWEEVFSQSSGSGRKRIQKHHHQEVETFVSEAKKRWKKLYEEYDTAFRFRLGGGKRLWGYRIKNKFFVKWYDPTHKVYPVEKKNT